MKKHRRLINKTDSSFFSNAEFKLKTIEQHKQKSRRRSSNIMNHLKSQLLSEDSVSLLKDKSKQKRNYLQKLNFSSTQKDSFKLPKSQSKRSKLLSDQELKNQIKTNINQFSQLRSRNTSKTDIENVGKQKKMSVMNYMLLKRSKGVSSKQMKKEKMEKSALQKFNKMVHNQNSEKEVNNQPNAQALYLLLQSNRKVIQSKNNNFIDKASKRYHDNLIKDDTLLLTSLENKVRMNQKDKQWQFKKQKQVFVPPPPLKEKISEFKNVAKTPQPEKEKFQESQESQEEISYIEERNHKEVPKTIKKEQNRDVSNKNIVIPQLQSKKIIKQDQNVVQQSEKSIKEIKKDRNTIKQDSIKDQQKIKQNKLIKDHQKQKIQTKNMTAYKNFISDKEKSQKQANKQLDKVKQNQQKVKKIIKENKKQIQTSQLKHNTQNNIQQNLKISQKSLKHIEIDHIPQAQTYNKLQSAPKINKHKSIQNKKSIEDQVMQKMVNYKQKQSAKNIEIKGSQPSKSNTTVKSHGAHKGRHTISEYDDQQLQEISIGVKNPKIIDKKDISEGQKKNQPINQQKAQPIVSQKKIPVETQLKNKESKKLLPPPTLNPMPKHQIPQPKQPQQKFEQEQQPTAIDQFIYLMERLEDIGQYRMKSKDLYSDKQIDKQLLQTHKICAYYLAHQFLYLTKMAQSIIKERPITKQYYNLTAQELNQIQVSGDLEPQEENIEKNLEQSKKLLKKCYDQCKSLLKKQQQILILDSRTNYHLKCCSFLIKQFKKIYQLYSKNTKNTMMLKRCIYLIQMYGILKAFNNEEIKDYEQYEDIEDPVKHLEQYKSLLI